MPRIGCVGHTGTGLMNALNDIVDCAIDFTDRLIRTMPSYRDAAIAGLRKLGRHFAETSPDHPAIRRLEAYLDAVAGSASE